MRILKLKKMKTQKKFSLAEVIGFITHYLAKYEIYPPENYIENYFENTLKRRKISFVPESENVEPTNMVNPLKYTFPSIRRGGDYLSLDLKTVVRTPFYSKYVLDEDGLSSQELDYNYRLNDYVEKHNQDLKTIEELKHQIELLKS